MVADFREKIGEEVELLVVWLGDWCDLLFILLFDVEFREAGDEIEFFLAGYGHLCWFWRIWREGWGRGFKGEIYAVEGLCCCAVRLGL